MRDWATDTLPADSSGPAHYKRDGLLECFDSFRKTYGDTAAEHAAQFNCFKYLYRYAIKHGDDLAGRTSDLNKLVHYAEFLIDINCPAARLRSLERMPADQGPPNG